MSNCVGSVLKFSFLLLFMMQEASGDKLESNVIADSPVEVRVKVFLISGLPRTFISEWATMPTIVIQHPRPEREALFAYCFPNPCLLLGLLYYAFGEPVKSFLVVGTDPNLDISAAVGINPSCVTANLRVHG